MQLRPTGIHNLPADEEVKVQEVFYISVRFLFAEVFFCGRLFFLDYSIIH